MLVHGVQGAETGQGWNLHAHITREQASCIAKEKALSERKYLATTTTAYSSALTGVAGLMAAVEKLSFYSEGLPEVAKKRYQEKLQLISGIDPFQLTSSHTSSVSETLPPVEASDVVSYLVLQTSFVTAQQFKAHKSLEAYNHF